MIIRLKNKIFVVYYLNISLNLLPDNFAGNVGMV